MKYAPQESLTFNTKTSPPPLRGGADSARGILTDRKAWTMSALTELRGLSLITTKICSSFSRPMKFPNHDFLASLPRRKARHSRGEQATRVLVRAQTRTYSGLDSGVKLDMSSDVGTERDRELVKTGGTFLRSATFHRSARFETLAAHSRERRRHRPLAHLAVCADGTEVSPAGCS